MKKSCKKWLFILVCFLFSGCVEKLEIDYEHAPNISITGRITNLDKKHSILIKHASSLQGTILEPYKNAKVSVQDDRGQEADLLEERGGEYSLDPDHFSVKIGDSYRLKIQLEDEKTYYSEWQELLPSIESNNLTYREGSKRYFDVAEKDGKEVLENTYEIVAELTNFAENKQFVYFEESGEFEYISYPELHVICVEPACYLAPKECCKTCWFKDVKRIKYNGLFQLEEQEKKIAIAGVIPNDGYRFNQGKYRSTIAQYTIGEKEFKFLRQVKEQITAGGVFDSQPSQIKGNIYQDGYPEIRLNGYFGVSSVVEKNLFINRNSIFHPKFKDDCRELIFSHRFLKVSSIKPSYWE